MNKNYFDIYYQPGDEPVFCYRSGKTVYEEKLFSSALISCGYNSAGYPLNVLSNFPSRLDHNMFREPFAFNLEIDGASVDFGLKFVDFITEKSEDNVKATLILESTVKPVKIYVHTLLDGTAMFSRYLEIENLSDTEMNISRMCVLSGGLETMGQDLFADRRKRGAEYSIGYFEDCEWGHEGIFKWHDLNTEIMSIDTRYSRDRYRHPMIFIRNNLLGEMWFSQIEWSGGCRFSADFFKSAWDRSALSFKAEITSHNPMYILAPKEKFATPRVSMGFIQGGLDEAINEMHAHARRSVFDIECANSAVPLIGCGMGAEHDMSVATSKAFIDQFADMGGEIFIIDAGWQNPPDREREWLNYNGTNIPNKDRYPNGLAELSDYCHSKGMKFALWLDIERLGEYAPNFKEHPEWRAENPFGEKDSGLIDLSNPEVEKWAEDEIARIITEYGLELLRVDHNSSANGYFNMRDTLGTGVRECLSLKHFNAVYRIYANLKKRFPDVIFENCAGGGGRSDLGMMRAFGHTWVSDWQNPPRSAIITNGMTMALPPEKVDRLFAGCGCHEHGSLAFHMRNTMLTHMTLNVISPAAAQLNEESMEFIRHSVEIYKKDIRPFLNESLVFHHTPEPDDNCIIEVSAPDASRGAIGVFTLFDALNFTARIKPRGIRADKNYEVTLDNSRSSFTVSGSDLIRFGIEVFIPSALDSELILYREI